MDEKKSYAGLVVWLVCFMLFMVACMFLPEAVMLRGVMQLCSLGICALIGMIYGNEKVYWINGVTYEEAMQATREQRKAFAWRHLKVFLWFAVPYFLFSCLSYVLGWNEWIDFAVGFVGMVAAAIATIGIRLK